MIITLSFKLLPSLVWFNPDLCIQLLNCNNVSSIQAMTWKYTSLAPICPLHGITVGQTIQNICAKQSVVFIHLFTQLSLRGCVISGRFRFGLYN